MTLYLKYPQSSSSNEKTTALKMAIKVNKLPVRKAKYIIQSHYRCAEARSPEAGAARGGLEINITCHDISIVIIDIYSLLFVIICWCS